MSAVPTLVWFAGYIPTDCEPSRIHPPRLVQTPQLMDRGWSLVFLQGVDQYQRHWHCPLAKVLLHPAVPDLLFPEQHHRQRLPILLFRNLVSRTCSNGNFVLSNRGKMVAKKPLRPQRWLVAARVFFVRRLADLQLTFRQAAVT